MISKLKFLFILVILFTSCSQFSTQEDTFDDMTVEITSDRPDKDETKNGVEDSDDSSGLEVIGPQPEVKLQKKHEINKKKYYQISFNFKKEDDFLLLGILDNLNQNSILLSQVHASGLGYIISELYNHIKNTKKIKWLLFKATHGLLPADSKSKKDKLIKNLVTTFETELKKFYLNTKDLNKFVKKAKSELSTLASDTTENQLKCDIAMNEDVSVCVISNDFVKIDSVKNLIQIKTDTKSNFSLSDYIYLGKKIGSLIVEQLPQLESEAL
jgi:hypothetical protein